ncbi:MAG: ATP-binding protein [Candidatus Methanomethylophilaceae archaeon]|nr:ATP-binding protein [Candidatus Methanomethylophilaceae archaeon]
MKELVRERYLSKIRPFYHDDGMIKVMTGVRRCGKSTIMSQIMNELITEGVEPSSIVYLDLDSKRYRRIKELDKLEQIIDELVGDSGALSYLFIDEVQNVNGFESLVNAYRNDGVSVFITGSNSYLLSGDLVTKLTGRYIEFRIMTFSFSEVREFHMINDLPFDRHSEFNNYLKYGGYPKMFEYTNIEEKLLYLRSVIAETIGKDILQSRKVRNRALLNKVLNYLISSPAIEVSSPSIVRYLRSDGIKTLPNTINGYLELIFSSKVAIKCERYDIHGKKSLKTLYKSYLADPSIHSSYPSSRNNLMIGHLIENIVFNEFLSRGYDVSVGKLSGGEIDFVVSHGDRTAYVQVAYLMPNDETIKREFEPLLRIRSGFPKYVISMDPVKMDRDGVRMLNLLDDFLLGDGFTL